MNLDFFIILCEFDEKIGPIPTICFPEINEDLGWKIASKSMSYLLSEESHVLKSLAFIPFPAENKKGIIQNIEWKDDNLRGRIGSGTFTLLFDEIYDLIFYKYIKDLEILFDKASETIIELKTLNVKKERLINEIKQIHEKFQHRLKELYEQEMGASNGSEAFPDEKNIKKDGEYAFKIVVCGDPACGKTSAILKFTDRAFKRTYIPTLGVNITGKDVPVNEEEIHLVLWDIAGQVKFQYLRRQLYEGARGILLLFDITRENTLKSIPTWYEDITNNLMYKEGPVVLLCGNKKDLEDKRMVSNEDVKIIANKLNIEYLETSALTGENIDKVFHYIAKELVNKYFK